MAEETIKCPKCGAEMKENQKFCTNCGYRTDESQNYNSALPQEIKKFNWGAFFLTWIWGIGNDVKIALFGLISWVCMLLTIIFQNHFVNMLSYFIIFATFIFSIWLGINGNKLAWNNKKWQSVQQFNNIQKKWGMWSFIAVLVFFGVPYAIGVITVLRVLF